VGGLWPYAGCMRYAQGGGLTAEARKRQNCDGDKGRDRLPVLKALKISEAACALTVVRVCPSGGQT
jgi:hypothetical protein